MRTVDDLLKDVRAEAARAAFPIDVEVYAKAGKDPLAPVLFGGSLKAPVCFFGRDLGKTEVALGQPLIGAGGRLIRAGVYEHLRGETPPKSDRTVESILPHVLLTNTVPYKPPGNRPYSEEIKARFRPLVAELLVSHWRGTTIIPLGADALEWFAPYLAPDDLARLTEGDDRFERTATCEIVRRDASGEIRRRVIIAPLPHPSPLNRRWLPVLPDLLRRRLTASALD